MSQQKFVKPMFPPSVTLELSGSTMSLAKVMVGKTPTYIGNPKKTDDSDYCPSPLIVFLSGEQLNIRGRQALQFIDAKLPDAAGRLLLDALRDHLSDWSWSEDDWDDVRNDVVHHFGGTFEVATTPQQMTEMEERLLAHAGATEQILQICRTNWIRPLPTPKRYLESQVGSEAEVLPGKWDEQAQLISVAIGMQARDVDLATRCGFRLKWKRVSSKVA